jgi:hypothetical protein
MTFVARYQILQHCKIWWLRYTVSVRQWLNPTLGVCTSMHKPSSQGVTKKYYMSLIEGKVICYVQHWVDFETESLKILWSTSCSF